MLTRVVTSARLHFGLFNLSGFGGNVDGGAGLALSEPACTVTVSDRAAEGAAPVTFARPVSEPAVRAVTQVVREFGVKFGVAPPSVVVNQLIPEHVGLGSKTACLMAVGAALSGHFDLGLDYMDIARLVKRGGTSGVGIHAFEYGGFVVDAGHRFPEEKSSFVPSSASGAPPAALVEHHPAPADCSVVHLRLSDTGLSGPEEVEFFRQHCPIPEGETIGLLSAARQTLLPGLRGQSLTLINEALEAIQGLGMKAREWTIQAPATLRLKDRWQAERSSRSGTGLPPLCLSSMGPTVFLLTAEPGRVLSHLAGLGIERERISVVSPGSGHLELSVQQ